MTKTKRLVILLTLICIIISIASIPTFAINQGFTFRLSNTIGVYVTYADSYNIKLFENDAATVRTTANNAPGWGFAFAMKYLNSDNNGFFLATQTSPGCWISGNNIVHPPYLPSENIRGRKYYVAARIDDDYNGPYGCGGFYNADYTDGSSPFD